MLCDLCIQLDSYSFVMCPVEIFEQIKISKLHACTFVACSLNVIDWCMD